MQRTILFTSISTLMLTLAGCHEEPVLPSLIPSQRHLHPSTHLFLKFPARAPCHCCSSTPRTVAKSPARRSMLTPHGGWITWGTSDLSPSAPGNHHWACRLRVGETPHGPILTRNLTDSNLTRNTRCLTCHRVVIGCCWPMLNTGWVR